MKTLTLLYCFCVLFKVAASAQGDSTQYIHGLPVTESDTARDFPQRDFLPRENYSLIPAAEMPDKLKEVLGDKSIYKGWEKMRVYLNKNTKLYMIRIVENNVMKIYGLDDRGNPVTFDEVSIE
jgi:hypothetical protein